MPAPRTHRTPRPLVIKVLALTALALLGLAAPRPARAQSGPPGGHWFPAPCDPQGHVNNYTPDGDGFLPMAYGSMTGSAANTYPQGAGAAGAFWPANLNYFPYTQGAAALTPEYFRNGISLNGWSDADNCWTDWYGGGWLGDSALNGRFTAHVHGTVSAYYVWRYQGADYGAIYPFGPAGSAAPDHLDVLVRASLGAAAEVDTPWGGALMGPVSASATASDGLGDTLTASLSLPALSPVFYRTDGSVPDKAAYHLVRAATVPAAGTAGVVAVSLTGDGDMVDDNEAPYDSDVAAGVNGYDPWDATTYGFVRAESIAAVAGAVQPDTRTVAMTTSLDGLPANGTAAANADPTNRHLTGWASLNWKVQDDDSPSVPFYDGYANYFLGATGFTPTSYAWQTNPAPFVQSMASDDDLNWELPDDPISEKHFHFDLGDDFTRFPQQTAVTGTATGADPYLGALSGSATATVTWLSPWAVTAGGSGDGGPLSLTPAAGADLVLDEGPHGTAVPADTVTAGQTLLVGGQRYVVLTVQPNADGTLTFYLAPALPPNPQDGDDIMALVAEYQARTQMAIAVGKVGLKLGFEMYDQLGQAYVMGPLTELTAPQLVELLGEAATVIGRGLEGSKAAEYYTALGSYGTSLLPGLAQKVAFLEAGVAAGTASGADLAAAKQALEETQTCIAICDQAGADMGGTYAQYDGTGTEVQNAVLDAQDWQAETAAGKNCFAAGTPVWMADGTQKPIEQVRAGDVVLSRDPQTGVTTAKAVLRTFRHQADATVSLRFPGGDTLQCTAGHPFYVSGRGFVPAGMLALGSSIVTRAGPLLALSGSERQSVPTTVYNFEVADYHTYFVGKSGLWVHNICEIPPGTNAVSTPNILDANDQPITNLDAVQTDAEGVKWVIETKGITGLEFSTSRELTEVQRQGFIRDLIGTNMTGMMGKDGLPVEGQLDRYVRALESGDTTLAAYFGTSDPATLMQMLKNGQIRIAFKGTASTMTQSMRFRIMRALRRWEDAHSDELGGFPVGLQLP